MMLNPNLNKRFKRVQLRCSAVRVQTRFMQMLHSTTYIVEAVSTYTVVRCCPSPRLTGITHCPDPSPAAFSGPALRYSGHHRHKSVHASKKSILPQSHAHRLTSNCMTAVRLPVCFMAPALIPTLTLGHVKKPRPHLQARPHGRLGSLLPSSQKA
jgi:hypothetical protein